MQKNWIKKVKTNAMDLPKGIFTWSSKDIAKGLAYAALTSDQTKGTKYQSAMSMLNFYINRAGSNLSDKDKNRLEKAKNELRKIFDK